MIDTGFSMLMGGIGISSAGFPGLVTALRGPESEMEAEILLPSSLVDIGAMRRTPQAAAIRRATHGAPRCLAPRRRTEVGWLG